VHLSILANGGHSFNRTIAEGLARMVTASGATAEIHLDGLDALAASVRINFETPRTAVGSTLRLVKHRRMFEHLVDRVGESSVIVVVAPVPTSFARGTLANIELLRERLPEIPIVNYAHYYLPTVDKWGPAMLRGVNPGLTEADLSNFRRGSFRMSRYDWYLVASVESEIPLPPGPQPYSRIGIHIDDGTLFPEQNGELLGLIDFAQTRINYPSFRKTQIDALERAGIQYRILEGRFTRSEIREIYRRTGVFFLAHRESFGLSIVEVQACGSLIATPKPEWAGAHWIKDDLSVPGAGRLSPNFLVYDNDLGKLTEQLEIARSSFDGERNLQTFKEFHPQLYHGDPKAVGDFLTKVEDGTINSRLHTQHEMIGL
jgi:hypothetical protein